MIIGRTLATLAVTAAVVVALPAYAVTGTAPLKAKDGHRSGCVLELQKLRRVVDDGRVNKRYVRAAVNVDCSRRAWPDGHVTLRVYGEGSCRRCARITRDIKLWRHKRSELGDNTYSARLECNNRYRRTSRWEYPDSSLELWAWAAVFPKDAVSSGGQWHVAVVSDQSNVKC